MGFGGKVAVVTGAGLGTTRCGMLADEGATVVAVARTEPDIPGATVIRADVTSIADMRGLAAPFLASDASQAITGAMLDVNGGPLFT